MTNIGSIYDEYDDFYDDLECNEAPVRLIASLSHKGPYSFLGEAGVMILKAILRNYQHCHQKRMMRTTVYTLQHNSYSAVMSMEGRR